MEAEHKDAVAGFLELMGGIKYFTKLKPDNKNGTLFTAELKVSSYSELNQLVSDLLKVSIAALKSDAGSSAGGINVLILLELALQFLPDCEIELLDKLHKLYLNMGQL